MKLTIISDCGQFRAIVKPTVYGAEAQFDQIIPEMTSWQAIGKPVAIPRHFHTALDIASDIIDQLQYDIACH